MRLLEEQHQKLARIIRSHNDAPSTETGEANIIARKDVDASRQATVTPERSGNGRAKPTTSALAAARMGSQARDSSPSLAREIASRRGIPQTGKTHPSPAAQARARQLSPESQRRSRPSSSSNIPPSVVDSQASLAEARRIKKAQDDEGFAKFYSQITAGTMSKLSAALAFAGLPLTADDVKPDVASKTGTVRASHEPDVKKIFSKAALNAVEEEHRQRGTLGPGFGPAESFYVVPPFAHTKAYSHVVRGGRSDALGEDDEDAFVDAREAQGPPSPKHSRNPSATQRTAFGKGRTAEELELENSTLKQTLEGLANRLADFEAHAQDASMAALTQSMMSTRPPPGRSTRRKDSDASGSQAMAERLRLLERQVEKDAEDRQRFEAEAKQQQKKLRVYEEKYKMLRGNARKKMEAKDKLGQGEEEEAVADDGMPGAA